MNLRTILISLSLPLTTASIVACGDDETTPATTTSTSDTTVTEETAAPTDTVEETTTVAETTSPAEVVVPTECAHEPACQDDQISTLAFQTTVNAREIIEETAPAGQFLSHVDGTAGGFNGTDGYLYARFTPTGLEPVRISDEDSLENDEWHIAFRRFVVRLNSGVSGPGCVIAAALPEGTEFGGVRAPPTGVTYAAEAYFEGASCDFVDDGTGINGPAAVLAGYWSYISCVSMTGNVFVLRLSDGHHVKLQVESYYDPAAQAECDEGNELPTPSGAGNFRVRWAYLD